MHTCTLLGHLLGLQMASREFIGSFNTEEESRKRTTSPGNEELEGFEWHYKVVEMVKCKYLSALFLAALRFDVEVN